MSKVSIFQQAVANLQIAAHDLVAESQAKDHTIADQNKTIAGLLASLQGAFVWDRLNSNPNWNTPANVGDNNPVNTQKPGTGVLTIGEPLTFRFTPGHQWNNPYVYMKLAEQPMVSGKLITPDQLKTLRKFRYSFDLSLPQEKAKWQALEWELQYASSGWIFNMAWQLLPTGVLRFFDYIGKNWIDSKISSAVSVSRLNSGSAVQVISEFSINMDAASESHTNLTLDGNTFIVGYTQPAKSGSGEYLNAAFQPDTNGNMDTYTVALNNIHVEAS